MKKELTPFIFALAYILLSILIIAFMTACSTTKYVPIETVRTDTIMQKVYKTDSIVRFDSIYIKEYTKGDTIFVDKVKYRYRDREVFKHDTTYIHKTDSISVPFPIEKELSQWEKTKMDAGAVFLLLIIGVVVVAVIWLIRKLRNK